MALISDRLKLWKTGFFRTCRPDEDLLDLIEWAFLDGQIDGFALDLAHIFLANLARQPSAQLPH